MSLPVLRQPRRFHPRVSKSLPIMEQYPVHSLRYGGIDGQVNFGDVLNMGVSDFSILLWVNIGDTGVRTPLAKRFDLAAGSRGYVTGISYVTAGKLYFDMSDGVDRWSMWGNAALTPFRWYHISFIVDRDDALNSYIRLNAYDDTLNRVGTITDVGNIDTAEPFRLGTRGSLNLWYKGLQWGVQLYTRTVSQPEIEHNMRNPMNPVKNGLALWLPMIEGQGLTLGDHSPLANNGTLSGGVAWMNLAKYEIQSLSRNLN